MKNPKTRIMIFGTFDGLHPGHLNLFKQARYLAENSCLIVSIARDKNVFKIKGRYPMSNERARMLLLQRSGLVDAVILSGLDNHIPHIAKAQPDIIALGYDQDAYVRNLQKDLKREGVRVKIVRLKPYKEKIYKNHLLKNARYRSSLSERPGRPHKTSTRLKPDR